MKLSDDDLRGRTVIASDGLAIGEVAALFLESSTLRLESLLVKLRKDVAERVGAGRSIFRAADLEIPAGLIQSVGDAVVLSVAIDGLQQVLRGGTEPAAAH